MPFLSGSSISQTRARASAPGAWTTPPFSGSKFGCGADLRGPDTVRRISAGTSEIGSVAKVEEHGSSSDSELCAPNFRPSPERTNIEPCAIPHDHPIGFPLSNPRRHGQPVDRLKITERLSRDGIDGQISSTRTKSHLPCRTIVLPTLGGTLVAEHCQCRQNLAWVWPTLDRHRSDLRRHSDRCRPTLDQHRPTLDRFRTDLGPRLASSGRKSSKLGPISTSIGPHSAGFRSMSANFGIRQVEAVFDQIWADVRQI